MSDAIVVFMKSIAERAVAIQRSQSTHLERKKYARTHDEVFREYGIIKMFTYTYDPVEAQCTP